MNLTLHWVSCQPWSSSNLFMGLTLSTQNLLTITRISKDKKNLTKTSTKDNQIFVQFTNSLLKFVHYIPAADLTKLYATAQVHLRRLRKISRLNGAQL